MRRKKKKQKIRATVQIPIKLLYYWYLYCHIFITVIQIQSDFKYIQFDAEKLNKKNSRKWNSWLETRNSQKGEKCLQPKDDLNEKVVIWEISRRKRAERKGQKFVLNSNGNIFHNIDLKLMFDDGTKKIMETNLKAKALYLRSLFSLLSICPVYPYEIRISLHSF